MATTATKRAPAHPLSVAALTVGVVASALALYGSFLSEGHLSGSRLNAARDGTGIEAIRTSATTRVTLQLAAYVLPFVLGVGAALMGGEAIKAVERRGGEAAGSPHAVFAIMIGGLSAVVSGCMILAVYLWPFVPTPYTY